ncbi:MAG TPA: hypothetical protein VGI19_05250 [Candidatus Cybelea sp.]
MFQRILVAAASLSILAACAQAQSVPQTNTAPASKVSPNKDCGGAYGVTVSPCPIRLTRHTKMGFVVTVSGPHVTNSYLGRLNACIGNKLCYNAEREGNSQVQWRITSGRDCGNAEVEFVGVNENDHEVGYAFLDLKNKYCP